MNYLAHLYLAGNSAESQIGNLLGDFMKGVVRSDYCPAIQAGIAMHQQIDIFTDTHPIFRQSKRRICPSRRRFAGILIDMFYDHFLAKHWSDYAEVPLPEFCQQVYGVLQAHAQILPERLQQVLPDIVARNWLLSYRDVDGIEFALQRMARRIRRGDAIANGTTDLIAQYEPFTTDFRTFFPQLIEFSNQVQRQQTGSSLEGGALPTIFST